MIFRPDEQAPQRKSIASAVSEVETGFPGNIRIC